MPKLSSEIEFPRKLDALWQPAPYKIVYGGRDGIKSWSFARALLIQGMERPLRILCARETQQSIRESVHQLLSEQVKIMGLENAYEVQQMTLKTRPHWPVSEFIFAGLRNLSIEQIKSYESVDICWVEEGQNVTKNSWQTLLPTIRKPGSEIWVSFNPRFATDDTYLRWVVHPPPGAVVIRTSWEDNKWLSPESRQKIEYLKATDPDAYDHVYGGACVSTVENAIYKAEVMRADKEGRICSVPYEPSKPVQTYWDLGYADKVAIWFAQAVGFQYRIIDYYENNFQSLDHYISALQQRGYTLGTAVLPWDGGARQLGTGRSIRELLLSKGFKVRVLQQTRVADGINAVRTIFHQCWFDAERCDKGLEGLRRYQWGPPQANGEMKREPLHDDASHPADAFRTLAMHIKIPEEPTPAPLRQPIRREYAPFG